MRAVVDTNLLMSAIFFGGAPGKVLRAWREGSFKLVLSPEILEKYVATAEILATRYDTDALEPILALIARNAEVWQCSPLDQAVCTDPDDDKFFACALASGARYIVSGDKALRRASGYRSIRVVTPRQFADEILQS
jgi:uncharacterized protein